MFLNFLEEASQLLINPSQHWKLLQGLNYRYLYLFYLIKQLRTGIQLGSGTQIPLKWGGGVDALREKMKIGIKAKVFSTFFIHKCTFFFHRIIKQIYNASLYIGLIFLKVNPIKTSTKRSKSCLTLGLVDLDSKLNSKAASGTRGRIQRIWTARFKHVLLSLKF